MKVLSLKYSLAYINFVDFQLVFEHFLVLLFSNFYLSTTLIEVCRNLNEQARKFYFIKEKKLHHILFA